MAAAEQLLDRGGRAALPMARTVAPSLPTRMPCWLVASTISVAVTRPACLPRGGLISSTITAIACGTSSRVRASACSRTSSAMRRSSGWSESTPGSKYAGPSGNSAASSASSAGHAVAGARAHGMQGHVVVDQPGHRGDRLEDRPAGLRRSTLLSAITTGAPAGRELLGDEAVAAARALAGVEHEQHGVDVAQAVVDRALHAARERVERPLESRAGRRARSGSRRRARRRARAGASSAACRRRSRRARP